MLKILPKSLFIASIFFFHVVAIVFANGEDIHDEVIEVVPTLEETIRSNSIKVIIVATIIIVISVLLTIFLKNAGEGLKKILFSLIVIPTVVGTLFIAGSTLYLNFQSISGGPVHWHAEYEIWDCGEQLELGDPEGLSNKVGSATLHEHNDNWIHLEGVVTKESEASLGKYFDIVGGDISDDSFRIPTNEGLISRHNGDLCPDGSEGLMQVFIYQTENKVYTQQKIKDPKNYLISPESSIPPGDCIIIEFDPLEKEKTDKLCEQYQLQKLKGNLYGD